MCFRSRPIVPSQNVAQALRDLKRHILDALILSFLGVSLTFTISWHDSLWKAFGVEGLLLIGGGWCAYLLPKVSRMSILWQHLPFADTLAGYLQIITSTWRLKPSFCAASLEKMQQVGRQHLKFLKKLLWTEVLLCAIVSIAYPIDGLTPVKLSIIGQVASVLQGIIFLLGCSRSVGVVRGVELGEITIQEVSPDTPLAKAGLQTGDIIEAINGQVLTGLTPEECFGLLYQPSRPLVLEVRRQGTSVPIEIRLEQDTGLEGAALSLMCAPDSSRRVASSSVYRS